MTGFWKSLFYPCLNLGPSSPPHVHSRPPPAARASPSPRASRPRRPRPCVRACRARHRSALSPARIISSSGAASRGKKQPASLAQSAVAMGIGYVVGVLGGAILAHAAYATIQCTLHPSSIPILLPSPRRRAPTKFRRGSPFSEGAFDFPSDSGSPFRGGFSVLRDPPRSRIEPAVEPLVNWGGV